MTSEEISTIIRLYFELVEKLFRMYIKRTVENLIKEANAHYSVVLLTGPRQVGKSTVLKYCDAKRTYVTLDDPATRELAINEPKLFMQRYPAPVIIDEIQYAPELLQYIKIEVDTKKQKGAYWLTGSQQFHMMKNVSESLAGRVAILNLMGFSLSELNSRSSNSPFIPTQDYVEKSRKNALKIELKELYEIIQRGSFPAINTDKNQSWEMFYGSYLQTYLERDIRDLSSISDEMTFLKFMRTISSRTGQLLNYADIANSVGISQPTAKSWLSLLISSGLVYLLEPYYNNLNKRMVKTPKLYFLDTGLCAYLTNWNTPEVLEAGAMSGAFFETFVVSEILKSYLHNGKRAPIYFYRDKEKKEIDLIIEQNGVLYPVEIKKTAKPDKFMIKNFKVLDNYKVGNGAVVCLANEDLPITENINIIPVSYI